ncbi:MAG: YbhB/YbcL family Raf kinase inhibitor-like protein [Kiritimatiellales bacterium]|nr:YbhB/YbcL family Raf kinase inhibitor-like protein [Kiritimatiellales bacterium]
MKKQNIVMAFFLGMVCCSGCSAGEKEGNMEIMIVSAAFESMAPIPSAYTCDGENISPPLAWSGVPPQARSLVLICDDPDAPAGDWVHWVCYDIPPDVTELPENIQPGSTLPCGGMQGKTDFGTVGYGGPCPPSGTHRYFFKVYALDTVLNLPAGQTKKQIEKAMQGHVLAAGEQVGTYSRRR